MAIGEMRWAVCGTGDDCSDFVSAVRDLRPASNQKVVAVVHHELSAARSFADGCQIGRYDDDCGNMLDDIEIDAIYVGCPVVRRFSVASAALSRGIAVLCSSPLTLTARQTRQLVALARTAPLTAEDRGLQHRRGDGRGVFLMEAVWMHCVPAVVRAIGHVTGDGGGDLGHVTALTCTLGTRGVAGTAERQLEVRDDEEEVGATLSLGCHGAHLLRALTKGYGGSEQHQPCVKALGALDDRGRDVTVSISLSGTGGRGQEKEIDRVSEQWAASMLFRSGAQLDGSAVICGTKKSLQLNGPFNFSPSLVDLSNAGSEISPRASEQTQRKIELDARQDMALHVAECLREGLTESSLVTLDDSLYCAELLEDVRTQLGVVFAEDTFHCANHTFHFNSQQ